MEDLSRESLQWAFGNTAVRPRIRSRWRESHRRVDDLLVDFNLVQGDGADVHITLAALLLFGKKDFLAGVTDGASLLITIVTPSGPSSDPYTVPIQQNIVETLRDVWTHQGVVTGCIGTLIPERCLRELLVNALIHRSYRESGPINVRLTPDHLFEIQNPGGFLRNLGPENLINSNPVHRNKLLTEATALLGFCEKSGSGIDIVYQEAIASGHDFPCFEGDARGFTAIISLEENTNFAKFVRYRSKEFLRLESLLIIKYIHKVRAASLDKLARVAQRPTSYTEEVVRDLVRRLILREGDNSDFFLTEAVEQEISYPLDRDQRSLFPRR